MSKCDISKLKEILLLILIILSGCASPDRVIFVTSTEIGIGADAKIGNVNIGYDRNELVIGPAYPETGAAPPVYGRLESNLKIIKPRIRQLYATGKAAKIATNNINKIDHVDKNDVKECKSGLCGKRKLMFFGTSTNIGFKTHFTGNAPDSINFGYKRRELSVIPLQDEEPTANKPDKYASVIAGIGVDASSGGFNETGMKLSQFIATGVAAENIANESTHIFTEEAKEGLSIGKGRISKIDSIVKYVAPDALLNKTKLSNLFTLANIPPGNTDREFVEKANNANELKGRLGVTRDLIEPLYQALIKTN